jgi:hypothetical protein
MLAALLQQDWRTPGIEELFITSDYCIIARRSGELTHKLSIGPEADWGSPNLLLAGTISSMRQGSAPAGTGRVRGFCPGPTVKTSFRVAGLNSIAMQSTGTCGTID